MSTVASQDIEKLQDRIRAYIIDNFLYTRPDYPLTPDESLLTNGIIDSMGVMELVEFLQAELSIVIPDEQITEENLGSLSAIVSFVSQKLAASSAPV